MQKQHSKHDYLWSHLDRLGPVVHCVKNTIHRAKRYTVDKYRQIKQSYSLESNLTSGWRYPCAPFDQLGPTLGARSYSCAVSGSIPPTFLETFFLHFLARDQINDNCSIVYADKEIRTHQCSFGLGMDIISYLSSL